jgi:hypothetical protein
MASILCMDKVEPRMQISLRNPRIACSTDLVSNVYIPLIEREFELKKKRQHLKICILSAIHVLIKAYQTVPLSG